jgi:hypothetical protein
MNQYIIYFIVVFEMVQCAVEYGSPCENSKQVTSHEKNAKTFHKLISLVKLQVIYSDIL